MVEGKRFNVFLLCFSIVYAVGLYFFYMKYVPLIIPFQAALLPILAAVMVLTAIKSQWGILFFVVSFPLINSLPYFFGIAGHIPHAPTVLLLFLFFFLGWLVRVNIQRQKLSFHHPVYKPLVLFSLMTILSGLITCFRNTNFFPFLSDGIYELATNIKGASAGGAIMSTVFHTLSYLTGFVFFFILMTEIKTKDFIRKIFLCLLASFIVVLFVGYYQNYQNISFGNTPFWVTLSQINSTFIDPNAFGIFLAVMIPLILGSVFFFTGWRRIAALVFMHLAIFIFPQVGSRSPLLGLVLAMPLCFILILKAKLTSWKKVRTFFKTPLAIGAVILILVIVLIAGYFGLKDSKLFQRTQIVKTVLTTRSGWISISPERYFLWKEAVHMAKDYPLSGIGMGAYIIELPNYYSQDTTVYDNNLEDFRRVDSAENYYLHAVAEMGWGALILTLWLFWVITRKILHVFKGIPIGDKNRFLAIGAMGGFIVIMVNMLFHSYIGSFDTKLLFWLVIGIILCLEGKEPEKSVFSKKFVAASIILCLLFGGIHLWNATHSLSLKGRTEMFGIEQIFGLDRLEKIEDGREFRWTKSYGGLTTKVAKPVIEIPLLASHPDISKNPVKVKIFLIKDFFKQKKLLDEIVLTQSVWKTYEYYLPEEVNQEVIVLIKVSRTWNPLKTLGIPDPRNLGVAIGKIKFKQKE